MHSQFELKKGCGSARMRTPMPSRVGPLVPNPDLQRKKELRRNADCCVKYISQDAIRERGLSKHA